MVKTYYDPPPTPRPPLPAETAAKVAPIKAAYPGFHPASDAPELRTATHLNIDYCSATYLVSWFVLFVLVMLASLGAGVVLGYLSAYLGG